MNFRRPLCIGLLLAAAVTLICVLHAPLLRAAARWLDVGEQRPCPAPYVMILNGGECCRPFVAAALIKAGLARHAIVTQVAESLGDRDQTVPPYHEINRRVLIQRGIAEEHITILPFGATTTRDEAIALASFLKGHCGAKVIVVTNDYHTRRSRWIFARILGEQARQVSFFSAPSDDFDTDNSWQSETGFVTVGTEYLKFAAYIVCYGHFFQWLSACLILAFVVRYAQRECPSNDR
jgi:uncharacterized SAM-binding protein YcdF (DUF218 family)